MNPNDYDQDGNNIVSCPICLEMGCMSKGKCLKERPYEEQKKFWQQHHLYWKNKAEEQ